jgi:hypothetical protein
MSSNAAATDAFWAVEGTTAAFGAAGGLTGCAASGAGLAAGAGLASGLGLGVVTPWLEVDGALAAVGLEAPDCSDRVSHQMAATDASTTPPRAIPFHFMARFLDG